MKDKIAYTLVTLALSSAAYGQAANQTKDLPPVPNMFSADKFGFNENITFYNLDSVNLVQFNQQLTWETPVEDLTSRFTLPVYSDGSVGAGMLSVGAEWTPIHKPLSFIDDMGFSVDVKLPTSSAGFGGDSVNVVLGSNVEGQTFLTNLSWSAAMTWEFNTNGDFIPVFGGFTEEDILNATGQLSYEIVKDLDVTVRYNFWYLDNGNSLSTIGPGLNWKVSSNIDLGFNCDIPFAQYSGSELNLIVGFGASIKF
jgi:hypothetical protein